MAVAVATIFMRQNLELINMDAITVISRQINGSFVEQRQRDGYINATALTSAYKQATGKRRNVSEWLENKRTLETLTHLSSNTGIPVFELYQVSQGSPENGGGTWIHPKLAVRFGIWLSDEFGYLVEQWVEEWLLNGQSTVLDAKVAELEKKIEQQNQLIEAQGQAIAQFQAQIQVIEQHSQAIAQLQTLLPPEADFMPPGWDAEVWRNLAPQDKRHFKFLHRRRRFRPSQQGQAQAVALPAVTTEHLRQKQKNELQQLVGEVSSEQKQQLEAAKLAALREFWSQAPEEDQRNMPF